MLKARWVLAKCIPSTKLRTNFLTAFSFRLMKARVALALHGGTRMAERMHGRFETFISVHTVAFPFECMTALTGLMFAGVPEVFPRLRFAGRFARVGDVAERDLQGWFVVSVGFDVEEIACEYALSFGPNLEVIEPRSLREKVIAAAQDVVKFYSDGGE